MPSVSKRCQAMLLFILSSALHAEVTENHLDEVVFIPGEFISIPCEVDIRVDYLHFTWTKNDKTLAADQRISVDPRSGTLIINSPTQEDRGRYRCFANNSYGISMSGEAKLFQAFHDNFRRSGSSETYIPEVGSSYIISCQPPLSHPPSRIYWALESDRLPEEFVDGQRIDTDFHGNLYFSNVEFGDGRRLKYFCVSHNQLLGSHNADDGRYLSPLPRSYASLKAPTLMWSSPVNDTAIVGSRKTLKCIFGGMPTPAVTWSDASRQVGHAIVSRGNEFTIPRVDSGFEGSYECRAENRAGRASNFINLRVQMKPTWSSFGRPPSLIEMDVDSNMTVNCDVNALPPPTFQWFVNGIPLRHGIGTRIRAEGGSLSIHGAMLRDTSTFQCLASNEHGSLLANVVVLVRESHPYFEEYPRDEKALSGFNVTFSCKVRGAPKPEIKWYKGHSKSHISRDFKYILHPTGSLEIMDVQKTDEATYFCSARNKLKEIEASAILLVREAPRVGVEAQSVVASVKENISISCAIFGFDPEEDTELIWFHEESEIDFNNPRFKELGRDLHIHEVESGDAGDYRCVLKWAGKEIAAFKDIKVSVAGVPDTPTNLSIEDCSSNPFLVKISWLVGPSNYADVSSCHIHRMTFSGISHNNYNNNNNNDNNGNNSSNTEKILQTIIIERRKTYRPFEVVRESLQVQPWTEYTFRVACSNKLGSSALSSTVSCKTQATIPSRNPSNVCVKIVGSNQLVIDWEPLNEDELNGDKFHYVVSYRPMHLNVPFVKISINDFRKFQVVVPDLESFTLFLISVQSANERGTLNVLQKDYIFGYSSEKEPTLTPTQFKVDWTNASKIKFSWKSHGEEKLGAFVRGFQIKVWKISKPKEFILQNITLSQTSHECGSLALLNLSQLNKDFEMDAIIDLKWPNEETFAGIRYITVSHKGPLSRPIPVPATDDIQLSALSVEQVGTNHAFIRLRCLNGFSKEKYSHRISLNSADKSVPLQLSYVRPNEMCSNLIKVRNLYPSKKYFINVTVIGSEKDRQEYVEINTKPFYVPDVANVENIQFVGDGRIDVILSKPENPPSDYCIQFKSGGSDDDDGWTDDDYCKVSQYNCSQLKNNSFASNSHFEIYDFKEDRLRKLTLEIPLKAFLVRIVSFNLLNNCSLARVTSSAFELLAGSNKESMLHQGENNRKDKSIIWFIVVAVVLVLCLVIIAAVFLCVTSWKGQVYSVRRTERHEELKTKTYDATNGCHTHPPGSRRFDSALDSFAKVENLWRNDLLSTTYNDFIDREAICRTPSLANTLV